MKKKLKVRTATWSQRKAPIAIQASKPDEAFLVQAIKDFLWEQTAARNLNLPFI